LLRQIGEPEASALRKNWADFDAEVHQSPETVGACGFVTYLDADVVGFASWDPRGWPVARVGHNCVRPAHQGRGYGSQQIEEVVRRLRERGFARVWARTSEHPFFAPARHMYARCGFCLAEQERGAPTLGYETVVYEAVLERWEDQRHDHDRRQAG
jgi:GNAT superfamily N-acetyltransferase